MSKAKDDKVLESLTRANYHAKDPLGEMTVTTSISLKRSLKTWAEDLVRENKRAGKDEATTVSKLVSNLLEQHQKNLERRSSRKGGQS